MDLKIKGKAKITYPPGPSLSFLIPTLLPFTTRDEQRDHFP
jgi:hypothetical protein